MTPVRWARATVVGVFLVALVVVVGPALWHAGSLFRDPFTPPVERRTVDTFDASGNRTGTQVTTSPAGGSLVERSLGAGGVLLLRLAIVSAAAYLAGALVYRTMTGTGAATELGQRVDAAQETIAQLVEAVVALGDELRDLRGREGQ